jgi:trans-aconitate methyltransferase
MSEWQRKEIVEDYAQKTADPVLSQYEREVNFPDLERLLSRDAESLLDFGCGPGEFTKELTGMIPRVEGADLAPMITIARTRYPEINFFEWDGVTKVPDQIRTFDVIFSKLTIQFIEDLDSLASNFLSILNDGGVVVFSVPNPEYIAHKHSLEYGIVKSYRDIVPGTNIEIHPLHRSRKVYTDTFEKAGFIFVEWSEPFSSQGIEPAGQSKRLNFKFRKSP